MPYKLSANLVAHSSDVRAVAAPTDDLILSASRDKTAVSWTRDSPVSPFSQNFRFQAGSKYINTVAYIPASPAAPQGYVATGGTETVINVYPLDSPSDEPRYSLVGHTDNVCALDASSSGLLISGSWDRTAKVWKDFQEVYELKGHEQSVWAVLIVDERNEMFLTASADTTIRLWMKYKPIRTFSGHSGAVRGLALIPDIGFASCSNDGEVRVWTTGGDLVSTLSGHTSFVYSVSSLPNGEIASVGEDRTLRVWRDEDCVQTIVHPATSVWSVASMPNGDIVTGCSDGVVRVFSSAEERWAPTEELKQYDDLVASQALPSQQVGDVKKTDLPGLEALATPGKKPGEVKMIRNGDSVEAHQWDSASMNWQKIGEVVDAVGPGRKQLHNGKEYDYVFDVDIQDGVPPLKLPYNANENPYNAAQRFLASHDLPLSYLDEVVRFIEKNASGVNLSSGNEFSDPFTGASRYQASSNAAPTSYSGSGYSDPFTGASRYQAQPSQPQSQSTSGYVDPLTGGTRYTPSGLSGSSAPAAKLTVIPVTTFLSFKQGNVAAMRKKVIELDEALRNEIITVTMATYPQEAQNLEEAYNYLNEALSSTTSIQSKPLSKIHLETVEAILERWPAHSRFPVIDLARLITGFCPSAYSDPNVAAQFFASLLKAAEWDIPWEAPLPRTRETNVLLTLRTLANAFHEGTLGLGPWVGALLGEVGHVPYDMLSKNHRVALATLLFNLSCVRLKGKVDLTVGEQHLSLLLSVLRQEKEDGEAAYRNLVALGNTLQAMKDQSSALTSGQVSEFQQVLTVLETKFPEARISVVIKDIQLLL